LEYFLLSPRAQYDIDDMKTGISDSGLNLTHGRFFTLMVPVAPLEEQRRLVGMIEEQLSRVDNALAIADELEARFASERRSILHAAFAGTLTAKWRETQNG
jgi:type I restriction enzyme S subunit